MADLPIDGTWVGSISLLESGKLRQGGTDGETVVGYSNDPHKQLADRTTYLKTNVDDTISRLDILDSTISTLTGDIASLEEGIVNLQTLVGTGWQTSLGEYGNGHTGSSFQTGQYGYRIAPDGAVEQWVVALTDGTGYADITWPIAFPNFYYGSSIMHIGGEVAKVCEVYTSRSLTGTRIRVTNLVPGPFNIFVVGKGY